MGLEAALVGKRQHLVVDTGGIADTQDIDASVDELFANPVDSHIALRTYQHLTLAHQCLTDSFYQRSGLACTWRSVDDGHILGTQHFVDSLLLSGIQIREVHGLEDKGLGFLVRIKQVAQIGQTALAPHGPVQGVHHHPIAGLVERQLHTNLLRALQIDKGRVVRHCHHHPVAIDIADGARKLEIADSGLAIAIG